jgi:hypothetical protein
MWLRTLHCAALNHCTIANNGDVCRSSLVSLSLSCIFTFARDVHAHTCAPKHKHGSRYDRPAARDLRNHLFQAGATLDVRQIFPSKPTMSLADAASAIGFSCYADQDPEFIGRKYVTDADFMQKHFRTKPGKLQDEFGDASTFVFSPLFANIDLSLV